ncbi:hypothetical protein ACOSQ2_013114 [Xanthoceras sorbifolium]
MDIEFIEPHSNCVRTKRTSEINPELGFAFKPRTWVRVRIQIMGSFLGTNPDLGAAAGEEEWKTMKRGDRVRQLERKSAATVLARCGGQRGRVEDDEGCGDKVRGSGQRRLVMKIGGNSTSEGRAWQSSAKNGARVAK